jgi:hypothetical protein
VAIAITRTDELSKQVAKNCENLGISNIRVIKKIERLVREIHPLISDLSEAVQTQTVHTLTILCWTKFQPDLAPPFEFYSTNSFARYLDDRELSEKEVAWTAVSERYGFDHLDDYDAVLMDYVKTGIADADAILAKAREQNDQQSKGAALAAIEASFRPFHDSFDDNLEEVVTSISNGLRGNYNFVSLNVLNEAITLFKSFDRHDDAQTLLEFFEKNQTTPEFWEPGRDPFRRPISDPNLKRVSNRMKAAAIEVFEPASEMLKAAETMNSKFVENVAKNLSVDQVYKLLKEHEGEALRKLVHAGLDYTAMISNASPEMHAIVQTTTEALKRIGSESKLNSMRIKKYGVSSSTDGSSTQGELEPKA